MLCIYLVTLFSFFFIIINGFFSLRVYALISGNTLYNIAVGGVGVGEGGLLTVYGTVVKTVYLVEASLLILMMHSVWPARCPLFDIKIIL